METFYLGLVIILFLLAISDLIVGVSNDAVNFLNSAIGAKVAPFRIIMLVAALGVLVGATFSNGMMEVARKGIFHPDQFVFAEIMIIFLAVMITDVILLDLFNTFGMPTSTTVSLVFEIMGAAVAIATYKIRHNPDHGVGDLGVYINSEKALAIISGILLSIVIAFTVGALIQYISRLIFSFDYKRSMRFFGGMFGGAAITAITYFMLIKGAKDASFMTPTAQAWISTHTTAILLYGFISWSIFLQVLNWLFNFNILKAIVLTGTFALAMAFAGNDLVNFIGVPLAGYESFKSFMATPGAIPESLTMESLKQPIVTNPIFLLIAGLIMVVTLWTSKKARSVVETTIDLSRQGEGFERFTSSTVSRFIVRSVRQGATSLSHMVPVKVHGWLEKRFERNEAMIAEEKKENAAFDMIRASVNLVVASALIAMGTSLKLPLSTTYVTFMVAMGTSLSDRAWGRESAVYRINGVLSVVGGWFLTALIAFTVAFLIATFINLGGIIFLTILLVLAIFVIIRTHSIHRRRTADREEKIKMTGEGELTNQSILSRCVDNVGSALNKAGNLFEEVITATAAEDIKALRKVRKQVEKLNKDTKKLKSNLNHTILQLREDSIDSGHYYVQVVDYLREIAHCVNYMIEPSYEHIDNNHRGLTDDQEKELLKLNKDMGNLFRSVIQSIQNHNFDNVPHIIEQQSDIINEIGMFRRRQIKRIKLEKTGTRNSMLYLDLLSESKNLLLYTVNLMKSMRDFITFSDQKEADLLK